MATLLLVACKPYDFDVDGHADFAFWTESGNWYRAGDEEPFWSAGTDLHLAVPGDYDGDDVWEPAVVDVAGTWTTGDAGVIIYPPPDVPPEAFADGATPVPADYDGDGDTDPAWVEPWTGTWHLMGVTDPIAFGTGQDTLGDWADVPVPADYDGDGDADLAVYRPSDGSFLVRGGISSGPFPVGQPVPADYDGDGDADFSVFNTHTQAWTLPDGSEVVMPSADPEGESHMTAVAVPADYTGSRASDLVVFDLDTGRWLSMDESVLALDPRASNGCLCVALGPATVSPWLYHEYIRLWFVTECDAAGIPCD